MRDLVLQIQSLLRRVQKATERLQKTVERSKAQRLAFAKQTQHITVEADEIAGRRSRDATENGSHSLKTVNLKAEVTVRDHDGDR